MAEISFGSLLSQFNLASLLDRFLIIAVLLVIVIFSSGVMFFLFKFLARKKKSKPITIIWWEEIATKMRKVREDKAQEITVPGSNLKLFYIKDTNTWLPRFTEAISPREYYVCITKGKELVNFTLHSLEKQLAEAKLNYDHSDMRWPAENMREFIKRNYRDKAEKWWKAYQGVISTAIYILVLTFSFVIIIYFMRGIVTDIASIQGAVNTGIEKIVEVCQPGSGLATA